jgi:23S rRNA (uracil1939-C5)-methyltransferase
VTPPEAFSREVVIDRMVPGGEGLGRVDGIVALVQGGTPGDRVIASLTVESPSLLRGRAVEVLSPGPHGRSPGEVCPRAADGSCGGCDWPRVRKDSAKALKTELVLDALRRVGGLGASELPFPSFVPSPPNYRLRNRLHRGSDGRLGFFAPHSNRVAADLSSCEIVSEALLARLPAIRESFRRLGPAKGELATLEDRNGNVLLGEFRLASGKIRGVSSNVNRGPFDGFRLRHPEGYILFEDGPSALELETARATFRVSVSSFFQGNRFLLDAFLDEVRSALREAFRGEGSATGPIRALDLYAGVGFLTRPILEAAAERGGEVVAVEVDASSSDDLSANLRRWEAGGLPPARGAAMTAEAFLAPGSPTEKPGIFDVVVADPPRAGLSPAVRRGLLRIRPPAIVMVSCDPPTLGRDLAAFRRAYRVDRLTLLDLFPGTHHVEAVALLVRRT